MRHADGWFSLLSCWKFGDCFQALKNEFFPCRLLAGGGLHGVSEVAVGEQRADGVGDVVLEGGLGLSQFGVQAIATVYHS